MENQRFIINFKNKKYDITDFLHKHPGGLNTLHGLNNLDISSRFYKGPPHSDAAMYLMKEYCIDNNDSNNNNNTNNDNKVNGTVADDKLDCKENGYANEELYVQKNTDETMEHLVDWSKAMVPQIGKLGKNYAEWVNKPVDRPLRLFGPNYLEILTKTPWWIIPIFWIPVISFIIIYGQDELPQKQNKLISTISHLFVGFTLWTLFEYTLHRFVFHLNPINASKYTCTFHFLLHGLHHKVPFDPYRLVFPPFPATILASLLYVPVYLVSPYPKIAMAGALIGYLCYDMMHFYLHYGSPNVGHLYNMKRYHYQHHFVHHDKGFGISTPIWDFVFGTQILLRKLKYILKW